MHVLRDPALVYDARPFRVVHVMMHIGDLIAEPDDTSLHRSGHRIHLVVQDPVPDFPGQIQAPAVLFQSFHDPHALFVVPETKGGQLPQRPFARMSERGMPQIVTERDRLDQFFVQPQGSGHCPRQLRYFQCMDQARPVMISLRRQKDLRLVLQPAKRLAVQDAVPVPHIDSADIILFFLPVAASGTPAQGSVRAQVPLFRLLQYLSDRHICFLSDCSCFTIRCRIRFSFSEKRKAPGS